MGGHHKAKNWGCPDTVDTNGSSPMLSTHQPAYLRLLLFLMIPHEPCACPVSSFSMFQLWQLTLVGVPSATVPPRFGRRAFSCCASKIWNEIPAAIRNAPTVQTFKHQLKTHLFSHTQTIITHDPTSHLATACTSDLVIYSQHCARRYKFTYYYFYYYCWGHFNHHFEVSERKQTGWVDKVIDIGTLISDYDNIPNSEADDHWSEKWQIHTSTCHTVS